MMKYTIKVKPRGGETTEFNTERFQDVMAIARFSSFPLETLSVTKQLRSGRHRIACIHWVMLHGEITIKNNRKIGKSGATTYVTTSGSDYDYAGSKYALLKSVAGA